MIFWLSSYPKSGNTWVRTFLANYLYNNGHEDIFKIMTKILLFPHKNFFKKIVNDKDILDNPSSIFQFFIKAQEEYNKDKKLHILKTHNFWGSVNGHNFSDVKNTCGAIYIVRDPRSIAVSFAHHAKISFGESIDLLLDEKRYGVGNGHYYEARSSWKGHLLSWLGSPIPKKILRYEDLKSKPFDNFKSILEFINKLLHKKIIINDQKIKRITDLCSFESLKKYEEKQGFPEKLKNEKFFRKGQNDEWKEVLSNNEIKKIEESFKSEMKIFQYI
jgi:hypothetical protein